MTLLTRIGGRGRGGGRTRKRQRGNINGDVKEEKGRENVKRLAQKGMGRNITKVRNGREGKKRVKDRLTD